MRAPIIGVLILVCTIYAIKAVEAAKHHGQGQPPTRETKMIKAVIINTDTRQVCHTLTEQCSINPEGYAKQYLRENLGRFPNYCIEMVDTQGRNGFGEVFKRINHGHLPGSFAQSGLLSEEVNHLPKDSAPAAADGACGVAWAVGSDMVMGPLCDPWWEARPGHYGDD